MSQTEIISESSSSIEEEDTTKENNDLTSEEEEEEIKNGKKEKTTGSKRANLIFPVGRIKSVSKKNLQKGLRMTKETPVAITAILECLVRYIIEPFVNHEEKHYISSSMIKQSLKSKEFNVLLKNSVFPLK